MAVHDKFADLAERLIAKHGRDMTLRKLSRTPADAAKPWRGPSTSASSGYEFEFDAKCVVVDWTQEELDYDQTRRGSQNLLVAAKAAESEGLDLKTADSLLDEGQVYSLCKGSLVKPGTTAILFQFQARQ